MALTLNSFLYGNTLRHITFFNTDKGIKFNMHTEKDLLYCHNDI